MALRNLGVPADYVASSAAFQIEKPNRLFFEKLLALISNPPNEIAYVGDRLDNDIFPSQEVGMKGIFLRRGPWGQAHALHPDRFKADLIIDELSSLEQVLKEL